MIIAFRVTHKEAAWLNGGSIPLGSGYSLVDFDPDPEDAPAQSKDAPAQSKGKPAPEDKGKK